MAAMDAVSARSRMIFALKPKGSDREQGDATLLRTFAGDRPMRYQLPMTQLLDRAVETVRALPPETQDALARILLQLAGDDQSVVLLSADEEASFDASLAQAKRGEFATEEQIRAIWKKHGL